MALTSTGVHIVEWAPSIQKWMSLMSVCLGWAPVVLTLWETLQDQQVGLTQAPFKLLLLPWVPECVRTCVHHLGMESLFHTVLRHSQRWALLAFKARCCGGFSSWNRMPGVGSLIWDSDPSLLGENLCNCNYSPVCGLATWGYGTWLSGYSALLTYVVVVPSLYI